MELTVDRDLCEANAVCCGLAPAVFELDAEEYLVIKVPNPGPDQLALVSQSRRAVPAQRAGAASVSERRSEGADVVSLAGKVAIVTGGAGGTGARRGRRARQGRRRRRRQRLCGRATSSTRSRSLGAKALFVGGDVADRDTADAMVAAADRALRRSAHRRQQRRRHPRPDAVQHDRRRVGHRHPHPPARSFPAHPQRRRLLASAVQGTGEPVYARVINTSSEAGLTGSEGQPNYSAAKAGIAAFTVSTARALARIGVRANAICPRARTAMTAGVFGDQAPDRRPRPAVGRARRAARHLSRVAGRRTRSPASCSSSTAAWSR